MNNEDKRFKQINRIATPIKVEPTNVQNTSDKNELVSEQVKQSINAIPPKKEVKKERKQIKRIKKETVIKTLIIVFVIGIIVSSIYLLIPTSNIKQNIKYNDITTKMTYPGSNDYYFTDVKLSQVEYINDEEVYQAGNFSIRKTNNIIYINNKEITRKEYFYSTVGLVDDLLIFTAKGTSARTTELFVVDKTGNIILNMYHIGDINGLVITDEENPIVYNTNAITIIAKNVIGDTIIPNNTLGASNPVSICNEDALFASSIEINKPVVVYYSLRYKGNHEFYPLESIYTESLEKYKNNHNYCK